MSAQPAPGHRTFFSQFLRSMGTIGAICPSSRYLARLIVDEANVRNACSIAELGPGDGVFTRHIMEVKPRAARFIALEKNEVFARALKNRHPDMPVIEGCATEFSNHARNHGLGPVQSVVSGLPWAAFPCKLQTEILTQVRESLCEEQGIFATFAYYGFHWMPAGRAFRLKLKESFREVRTSRVEIRNLPPAFVYTARK